MNGVTMNSIYSYQSYRTYLKDWYEDKKKKPSGFTFEKFATIAGLRSPNYLKLIIAGSRNLTVTNIHQFGMALKMSEQEVVFFEALVLHNQAKSSAEESFYKRRLRNLRKITPKSSIRIDSPALIESWYFPAVTVSLNGRKIDDAPKEIAKSLGIPQEAVNNVISLLINQGLAEIRNGVIELKHDHYLKLDPSSSRVAEKRYLQQQLLLSQRVFDKRYGLGPKFLAHTFTIDPASYQTTADRIVGFLETLTADTSEENSTNVVQLNVQFFSVSE